MVTVMLVQGWTVTEKAGTRLTWQTALYWLVPLADPPGSAWGYDFVLPLWYIRTYLWLLLLSPFLLWTFRRWPVALLSLPPVVLLAIGQGLVETGNATGDTVAHLATFGACWMLGFAHYDGKIRAMPRWRTVGLGLLLMAAGLAFAFTHQQPDTRWDIDDIDPANAVYSVGAVLILLRLYPRRTFLERMPRLSKLVSAMNSRAMTIYLWGNVCIWAATPVIESNPWTVQLENSGLRGTTVQFFVAWLVLFVVVLAVGWAEDVAAGRHPRLVPWPKARRRTTPVSASAAEPESESEPASESASESAQPVPRAAPRSVRVPGVALGGLATAVCVVLVTGLLTSASASTSAVAGPGAVPDLPVAGPFPPGPDAPSPTRYALHVGIQATVFWVGAVAQADAGEDGQSLASAWDNRWAVHYGGCDGTGAAGASCGSDVGLRAAPAYFPTAMVPQENPFYVGLPYNDLVSPKSTDRRQIPWSADPGFSVHLNDRSVSFVKNRWVSVGGPGGTCYAQVEDSGPGALDPRYVMGTARPRSQYGINLSPAVYRCVGLDVAAGSGTVNWRFVDAPQPGPWATVITTRQASDLAACSGQRRCSP